MDPDTDVTRLFYNNIQYMAHAVCAEREQLRRETQNVLILFSKNNGNVEYVMVGGDLTLQYILPVPHQHVPLPLWLVGLRKLSRDTRELLFERRPVGIVQEHDRQFWARKYFVRSGSVKAKRSPWIKARLIPSTDWPCNDNAPIGPQRAMVYVSWRAAKYDLLCVTT